MWQLKLMSEMLKVAAAALGMNFLPVQQHSANRLDFLAEERLEPPTHGL
jgi:hypothetical protein